jgi:hypothetical protein
MKTRFKIIETENYILAVSDEEINENNVVLAKDTNSVFKCNKHEVNGPIKQFKYLYSKVISYQPKGNAPELNLPLLPEIVVEDDVEKLAMEKSKEIFGNDFSLAALNYQTVFKEGYKSATKVYSEEDMRKAIELSRVTYQDKSFGKTMFKYKPGEVIQLTKDSKTPKFFVAEMEQVILKDPNSCEYYIEVGCIEDICTCYTFRLKTTTVNNKTYLVGNYE